MKEREIREEETERKEDLYPSVTMAQNLERKLTTRESILLSGTEPTANSENPRSHEIKQLLYETGPNTK
jgi:hypothetical protein